MLLFVLKHASESIKVKSTVVDTPSTWLLIYLGYLPWLFAVAICSSYLSWEFAVAICRRNMLWLVAARTCCGYLQWVFCICKQILFGICKQIFFIWKQTLLDVSKSFLFVKCSLLKVFLFVIVVAVMGHRK